MIKIVGAKKASGKSRVFSEKHEKTGFIRDRAVLFRRTVPSAVTRLALAIEP
jgi:hypothetical protein